MEKKPNSMEKMELNLDQMDRISGGTEEMPPDYVPGTKGPRANSQPGSGTASPLPFPMSPGKK